jgi:hypothetical protein
MLLLCRHDQVTEQLHEPSAIPLGRTAEGTVKQAKSWRQLFPRVIFCHEVCSSCKRPSEDGKTALVLSVLMPGDPNGCHASTDVATRVLLHICSAFALDAELSQFCFRRWGADRLRDSLFCVLM